MMKLKITFTDGVVVEFASIRSAVTDDSESFLEVIEDSENDHSFDLSDISTIELTISEMK